MLLRPILVTIQLLLFGCQAIINGQSRTASCSETSQLTAQDFAHLRFLEGHWVGTDPQGAAFYQGFSFPVPGELRAGRFETAAFERELDHSLITLEEGAIVSRWASFEWRASEVAPGLARFEPVTAPSSFEWRRVDADHVQVVQRFADAEGAPQQYVLDLVRSND